MKKFLIITLSLFIMFGGHPNFLSNQMQVEASTSYKTLKDLKTVKISDNKDKFFNMWACNNVDDNTNLVMGGLNTNNIFYVYNNPSLNVKFLPTSTKDVYMIQLEGNSYFVDNSIKDNSCLYQVSQKYYEPGKEPYNDKRAHWRVTESSYQGKVRYLIQNVKTGRYMDVYPIGPIILGKFRDFKLMLNSSSKSAIYLTLKKD